MRKILFLCHGNICRSPMAEYIMKDKVKKLHLENEFIIDSKALSHEEIGNSMYYLAINCLDRHNISYTKHIAKHFEKEDYDYYDEIYIMDESNKRIIDRMIDDKKHKIRFLNSSIEDPWYTGNFDKVFELISQGIDAII